MTIGHWRKEGMLDAAADIPPQVPEKLSDSSKLQYYEGYAAHTENGIVRQYCLARVRYYQNTVCQHLEECLGYAELVLISIKSGTPF